MRAGQEGRSWGLRLVAVLDMGESVEVVGEGKGLGLRGCGLGCSSARTCRRWVAFSLIYPRFARGRCNEGFSSKASRFCKGYYVLDVSSIRG